MSVVNYYPNLLSYINVDLLSKESTFKLEDPEIALIKSVELEYNVMDLLVSGYCLHFQGA